MENNKNLFVIPTNNPSRVYGILGSYRLGLTSNDPFYTENFGGGTQNQNVYVTSNEEIKDGEYGICLYLVKEGFKSHQAVFKMDSEQRLAMEELGGQKKAQVLKVILTQDQDLIKDGVQPIPDEFLVWFVEKVNDSGKPIDIVELDKVGLVSDNGRVLYGFKYKIIIPKEPVCTCKIGEPYNNTCCKVHGSVSKEMLEQIENQVKFTETRGEKIAKYLDIFKGQTIYNDIALAIEFGYQLRLEEEKDGQ